MSNQVDKTNLGYRIVYPWGRLLRLGVVEKNSKIENMEQLTREIRRVDSIVACLNIACVLIGFRMFGLSMHLLLLAVLLALLSGIRPIWAARSVTIYRPTVHGDIVRE